MEKIFGVKEGVEPWGYHLQLNCGHCDPEAIRSEEVIKAFSKELVEKIEMVAFGEPIVVNFGSGNKSGYTLMQLIETSNISGHFCNEDNAIFFDVFSCKEYSKDIVYDVVDKYFSPKLITEHYNERSIPQSFP